MDEVHASAQHAQWTADYFRHERPPLPPPNRNSLAPLRALRKIPVLPLTRTGTLLLRIHTIRTLLLLLGRLAEHRYEVADLGPVDPGAPGDGVQERVILRE